MVDRSISGGVGVYLLALTRFMSSNSKPVKLGSFLTINQQASFMRGTSTYTIVKCNVFRFARAQGESGSARGGKTYCRGLSERRFRW